MERDHGRSHWNRGCNGKKSHSRVILKCNGEYIYTPLPLPMFCGGEETHPPWSRCLRGQRYSTVGVI